MSPCTLLSSFCLSLRLLPHRDKTRQRMPLPTRFQQRSMAAWYSPTASIGSSTTFGEAVELPNQANKLIQYVGQQVEITGQPGIETIGTTVDSLASSAEEIPVFKVVSVKSAGVACASDIRK
jgi:hypothetical protein